MQTMQTNVSRVSMDDHASQSSVGQLVAAKRALLDKFGAHALEPHVRIDLSDSML